MVLRQAGPSVSSSLSKGKISGKLQKFWRFSADANCAVILMPCGQFPAGERTAFARTNRLRSARTTQNSPVVGLVKGEVVERGPEHARGVGSRWMVISYAQPRLNVVSVAPGQPRDWHAQSL